MKWYWYIVCAVLIVVGIFSSIELVEMFNVASKEYGTAITIETKNNYDEIAKYDFGTIAFDSDDYINFSNVTTFAPIEFDGKDKDYILLFNDQPAVNTVVTNGKVVGDVNLVFYGLEGEKVSKAELHFVVEYFASQTKVTTTITNENDSVAYLETYMGINGAILKVVERSASIIGVLVIGFVGILLYIYWPAITGTVNGSKYYTAEEVQEAYDEGYEDALKNKNELTEQVNYYKELTDSYYSTILEYQTKIEEYETLNETNQSTISALEQNKKDLQSQVESLTLNKADNEETIKDLNSQIETLQNEVQNLESSETNKDEQIVQLNSQISNLQEMVLQLQTTNDLNTSTIKTLNSQITSLNNRIIELSNQVVSNDNSLNSLKSKIQELEKSISYYENYIASLESEEQIVVTFEFAGSVYNIQVIDKNSSLSVVDPTSTEFVIFNYWTVDGLQIDLSTYTFTQNTKVVADVTYKYQVKFLVDGEIYGDIQVIEEGNLLSLPENPTKDKHKFVGWSLDGKEVISNIETLPVNEDLTYIAIFETSIYVTFMNGTEIYDSIEVVDGKITSLPEDPQKDQYFFNSWKLDSGEIIDLNEYQIEDSLIVYADYTYNWDRTYEGRSSGTYYLTVNVKNQEIVSVSYMGKTQEVKKLENGKYRTVSGISATSGSYTYIHFTMEFSSTDGRIYVTYKWNKSSNYDYQGASTSSTFYANRVE